jgi:NADH-quinone oxidoreductase subunit L
MGLACGVGAFSAGIFHVFTHAFFKACLFLGSGSVIHAMHHEQDMRKMGGLKGKIPQTHMTMLIATLAIAGIAPLAGFFSKDLILGSAFASGHYVLFAVGLFTALMTAFYMFRLYRMTFSGEFRGGEELEKHVHESPATMTVPLWVLAFFSIVAGVIGLPGNNLLEKLLAPVVGEPTVPELSHGIEYTLMGVSLAVAIGGLVWAVRWYGKSAKGAENVEEIVVSPEAQAFEAKTGLLGQLVAHKWNVDEGIEALVLNPFRRIGNALWKGVDALLIDGVVNASAFLVELAGDLIRFFTTGNVRNYALTFSIGVLALILYIWVKV